MINNEKTTTSKTVLAIIVFLYFIGALLGTILVIVSAVNDIRQSRPIDTGMFIAYAAYIGGPTATAIGFYAWKSKAENILKIQRSNLQPGADQSLASTLANMEGN